MKRFISLAAAVVLVLALFAGCAASYSDTSLANGLAKAGYTVDRYDKNTFEGAQLTVALETSKMEGLQKVIYAYKTVNDANDGILILVFDTTEHADKYGSTSTGTATATMSLLYAFGRSHAPESDTSVYGTANNIIWAGSSAAKSAAGIE